MSDSIRPKRTRPRPNRAYGIKAESEQAHINAEEEKTDAEQVPRNQGKSPSKLISMLRRKRPRLRWPLTSHACAEHAEKGKVSECSSFTCCKSQFVSTACVSRIFEVSDQTI
uniref:Uncharacterized protein n=1 Tax=Fagus sylvatica TaxID=28930 RepID=A0A2N9F5G7_FAGSY